MTFSMKTVFKMMTTNVVPSNWLGCKHIQINVTKAELDRNCCKCFVTAQHNLRYTTAACAEMSAISPGPMNGYKAPIWDTWQ